MYLDQPPGYQGLFPQNAALPPQQENFSQQNAIQTQELLNPMQQNISPLPQQQNISPLPQQQNPTQSTEETKTM